MSVISGNITFAVVQTTDDWKNDLTFRFCEYFNRKINKANAGKILTVKGVDEAITRSGMGFVIVFYSGYIPFSLGFFEALSKKAEENSDIFLADLVLADDYVVFDRSCVFINKTLWLSLGSPAYNQIRVKDGPDFDVSIPTIERSRPKQLAAKDQNRFIPGVCGQQGAAMIIKQLEIFKIANSLTNIASPHQYHFIKSNSPFLEIKTETQFEKLYLPKIRTGVLLKDEGSSDYDQVTDIVVAPAQGLRALTLAENTKAKHVIVYDYNPLSLEFQKRIFKQKKPTTFGEVVYTFKDQFPEAAITDEYIDDANNLVTVLPKDVIIDFKLVDLFSFEAEEFLKSIDHTKSLLIDFSDIFVYPYNYYRRPLRQVQALFAELYSILKSRTGPTKILGFGPGYQRMDSIEINTQFDQFLIDPTMNPDKLKEENPDYNFKSPIFTPTVSH